MDSGEVMPVTRELVSARNPTRLMICGECVGWDLAAGRYEAIVVG